MDEPKCLETDFRYNFLYFRNPLPVKAKSGFWSYLYTCLELCLSGTCLQRWSPHPVWLHSPCLLTQERFQRREHREKRRNTCHETAALHHYSAPLCVLCVEFLCV